ncbi:hypothetical protein [Pacificimonas flava]|nr:hypothetical protein [Pacificimonas flava]MBB5278971.1 hypothetical protein [Pacificimonas flava]
MDDQSADYAAAEEPAFDAPPVFSQHDERRMHVRAYNDWAALLNGREFPAPADLDGDLDAFGGHSILLDFAEDQAKPKLRFVGERLREECDLRAEEIAVGAVPPRSLISRLTDHYLEIIANRAPIGFEAEFISRRGNNTLYRGILMPLSSNGRSIDCMYGVINWKELAEADLETALKIEAGLIDSAAPADELEALMFGAPTPPRPVTTPEEILRANGYGITASEDAPRVETVLRLAPEPFLGEGGSHPQTAVGTQGTSLADCLAGARDAAATASRAGDRSRTALYRALSQAYDFHLQGEAQPEAYAEMLEAAGLKRQARAPMTPTAKLVFGADYDKARLTEFAAGLSCAARAAVPPGGFAEFVEAAEGGLKGLVQAERAARRQAAGTPRPSADTADARRSALRQAAPSAELSLDVPGEEEFILLVARREPGGRLGVMGAVAEDEKLLDRALRRLD